VVYCSAVLAGASKSTTAKLQQVWNAAAHVVNDMQKYDCRLTYLLHYELHWLDVQYKLCAFFHRCHCLQHKATTPQTLLVSSISGPLVAINCLYLDTDV